MRVVAVGLTLGLSALCGCGSDKTVDPGPLLQLLPAGGDNQAALVGHALPLPIAVVVKRGDGGPVSDIKIAWAVTAGSWPDSYPPTGYTRTDAAGIASVTWTLGDSLGTQSITASVPGQNVSPVTLTATAKPMPMVLQNTGSGWNMTLTDTTNVNAALTSIWGADPSNIFAVGKCGDGPMRLRYNGSVWTVPTGCPGSSSFSFERYTSVWGNSASDVFAVRQYNHTLHTWTAIDHFDGQSWTLTWGQPCDNCGYLARAVWTGSAGSAIAVGDAGTILRFDGASWKAEPSGTTVRLSAIWGAGASGPVFAVGGAGTILVNNGSGWTVQTSGTTQPLNAVWGTSGNDVWAVGGAGTILHYDGTTWTAQSSGSTQSLNGLWGSSGSSVFAVGSATTILHYDGSSWAAQTVNAFTNASMNLTGVWGISPSNIIAVGQAP